MGAACAAPARTKSARKATILMGWKRIRQRERFLRRPKRRRRLPTLLSGVCRVRPLQLVGRGEPGAVGVDLLEVLGEGRTVALGFLQAHPSVPVGFDLFPLRG